MSTNPSLMVHNLGSTMMSVAEALANMSLSKDNVDYILSKREEWATFGKMNSHLYRAMLFKRMNDAGLSAESKMMVSFLFGVIKNRDRVIRAMEAMDPTDQAKEWFSPVKNFISTHVTQYVSDVVRSKKFPAVNIPNCNPGFDVLVYVLITPPNDRSFVELFKRPTASQLNLDNIAQYDAMLGYQEYWDSIVRGSKNPDAKTLEAPMFREDYYANVRDDKYCLVDLNLREVQPKDFANGYTYNELKAYFMSIDPKNELDEEKAVFIKEMRNMPEVVTADTE